MAKTISTGPPPQQPSPTNQNSVDTYDSAHPKPHAGGGGTTGTFHGHTDGT